MASPEHRHDDEEHQNHHHDQAQPREKLKFFKSPVAGSTSSASLKDTIDQIPQFRRYEEPTLLEIFYDLFFAANYNVFSENREVTNHNSFKAYIGYFSLLWLTWFLTTAYDVRFLTDSIFERAARGLHLGVLVGFAVVAPIFDPSKQNASVMQGMSIMLCMSRITLAVEYGNTLWHVKRYKRCRLPLYLTIALNIITTFIYLGVAFRFTDNKNSRVFVTWYVISALEAVATLAISYFWPVMGFSQTHLIKRMTLLTVMMLGDGLVNIAKEIVIIVKSSVGWSADTIGAVTAGVATIYFVFLVYFDWLRSTFYMAPVRQIVWTALHYPLHLSMVLFIQAFTQYIIWGELMRILAKATADLFSDAALGSLMNSTSAQVANATQDFVDNFFLSYPPKVPEISQTVQAGIKNLSSLPDTLWNQLGRAVLSNDFSFVETVNNDTLSTFVDSISGITSALNNNIFQILDIDVAKDEKSSAAPSTTNFTTSVLQGKQDKTFGRFRLLFAYGYLTAGLCLIFMSFLSIVARTTRWKPWPLIRLALIFALAIGTASVSAIWYQGPGTTTGETALTFIDDPLGRYLMTPWVILTIFVVFTVVLILTHIGAHGAADRTKRSGAFFPRAATFFSRKNDKEGPYDPVSLPLTPSQQWSKKERSGSYNLTADDSRDASPSPYGGRRAEDATPSSYDPLKLPTDYRGPSLR
ncbi:hypothetical protein AAL_01510 [Moelleriella libera RCEF 2490]|uniref:Low temperature requirement A n=1 Tax=Moelleriella libera RCEF 2490 TaxID=1081109 RepID=A0A166U849_9HYPO|nr:hypothetical protein AAL_01510 [Moelleriella libera RCEF 2490]